MNEESIHVVMCITPGLSCCNHRLVATGVPAENVQRREIWCKSWRENHSKDGVIRACEKDFKVDSI